MSSVHVVWKGNCRSIEARTRLLLYLRDLARLSEGYLRPDDRPHLTIVGEGHVQPRRSNIELIDETVTGPIVVSSSISLHPEILIARAREAGMKVLATEEDAPQSLMLDEVHLRGIDFKLFDPRALYPENDRMSFVFIECPEHHFLDGRLVAANDEDGVVSLTCPSLRLESYLEDWTDCLFAWARFFLMGDLWWWRHQELQGYDDYRGVFEALQTSRGCADAEDATFDAVLSTFRQHAEYWRCEVQRSA